MFSNCGAGENSWESLGLQGDQTILSLRIDPEYSLEGLMLKSKLQYFVHFTWKVDSLKNISMLGKTEDRRRRGWQRTTCLDDISDSMDISLSTLREIVKNSVKPGMLPSMGSQSGTILRAWTTTDQFKSIILRILKLLICWNY